MPGEKKNLQSGRKTASWESQNVMSLRKFCAKRRAINNAEMRENRGPCLAKELAYSREGVFTYFVSKFGVDISKHCREN